MAYVERGQSQSALEFLNVIWFDEKSGTSIKKTIDSARTGPAGGGLAQIKLLVAERSIYLAARKCASLQLNPTCDVIFYTLSTDDPNFLKREILPFAAMGLVSNIDGIDLAFYKGKVYVFSTSIALIGGTVQGTYISFKQGDHWQIVSMSSNVFGQLAVEMVQENNNDFAYLTGVDLNGILKLAKWDLGTAQMAWEKSISGGPITVWRQGNHVRLGLDSQGPVVAFTTTSPVQTGVAIYHEINNQPSYRYILANTRAHDMSPSLFNSGFYIFVTADNLVNKTINYSLFHPNTNVFLINNQPIAATAASLPPAISKVDQRLLDFYVAQNEVGSVYIHYVNILQGQVKQIFVDQPQPFYSIQEVVLERI